ncbi:3-keto-5-aminohexanoate cleavage protein [Pokkaliibacter plantistimulans]|uniref:3-keto-5-aminohexanoate cleavage protein n=1 Tax=Proteobacteria bacterium 228 TaxID=2083153 RepID=A0A2S5KSP7_9PROT|nr:3-keto-5-aminohexanoate cleavage protein [Pokkaliibacter plantistimulans]PPC77549.1 3-keto-5-aminohexanoate cleavage protein [Pokkaliibacter plantistimulans]
MPRPYIMVAPNGARRGKADHPRLPISTAEIVETAKACYASGAQALHLHIRDEEGEHSLDAGRYCETLAELSHQVPVMRVQITTEAVGRYSVAQQLSCLQAVRPEWASIAVREIAREPALAANLYNLCANQGTEVQHILYDEADIALLNDWQARGIVQAQQDSVLFVLGRYSAGQRSTPDDLMPFRRAMPDAREWMVCAFGPDEHACLAHAASQGGALRIGFENSLVDAQGNPHADNAASVAALLGKLQRYSE